MANHNEVDEILQFIKAFRLTGGSQDAECCIARLTADIDEEFLMDRAEEVKKSYAKSANIALYKNTVIPL